MNRFITAVTVQKFIGEASTMASERSISSSSSLHVVVRRALPAAVAFLLRAGAAVGAELDVPVDQVDFRRFRPRFPRRGQDFLDRRVDDAAFAVGAEDGGDSWIVHAHQFLCRPSAGRWPPAI